MTQSTVERKRIVVLTVSSWREPKRLRKQLAEVLSQDWDVVYVTLPYGLLKPSNNVDFVDEGIRVISLSGPIFPLRFLARLPWLRGAYEKLLGWRLRRRLGDRDEINAIFCFTAIHPGVLAYFPKIPIIYVANDDHASMAGSSAAEAAIHHDEARVIAYSDRIVSVSAVIARNLSRYKKPVHVMYPGHDCQILKPDFYMAGNIVKNSICFFGYIDWRIDFDLLAYMLDQGYRVTLIGPVVGVAFEVKNLSRQFPDSFEVKSAVASNLAPKMLSTYQVLVMPYRYKTAEQAEVMELPNKTFIYFSALRPVVTTWMPNLKLVEPGLIYRADTHEGFLSCCQQAMDDDCAAYISRRSSLAQQNTWGARRETLRALILGTEPELSSDFR
jgi:hypothetical protein